MKTSIATVSISGNLREKLGAISKAGRSPALQVLRLHPLTRTVMEGPVEMMMMSLLMSLMPNHNYHHRLRWVVVTDENWNWDCCCHHHHEKN